VIELILRGGLIVRPDGIRAADIAVADGRITRIGRNLTGDSPEEIDCRNLWIFPGVVDTHVHFNEPGRAEWEGIASGSRALAAGGGTVYADMPLNSSPPVLDRKSFESKRRVAEATSVTDFALWGGLVPGNLHELADLATAGAIGFKAFMCNSGLDEFPAVDDLTLFEGLCLARKLDRPLAVHAESDSLLRAYANRAKSVGLAGVRAFLASRPILTEVEAVGRALLLAKEAGARLHIVHVSSGRAATLITEAKAAGQDVTLETCPHYLLFTEEDLERLGPALKCCPPVRNHANQAALWQALTEGQVDLLGSDHSPAPTELKQGSDFSALWGGVAGIQSTLPALLTGLQDRGLSLEIAARVLSGAPAERFRLSGKGLIEEGYDADLALVDPRLGWTLDKSDLRQRHPISPYLGMRFTARVQRTLLRGRTIYSTDGAALEPPPSGRFIQPT